MTESICKTATPESDMANLWRRPLISALAVYAVAASVFLLAGGGGPTEQRARVQITGQKIAPGLHLSLIHF